MKAAQDRPVPGILEAFAVGAVVGFGACIRREFRRGGRRGDSGAVGFDEESLGIRHSGGGDEGSSRCGGEECGGEQAPISGQTLR